MDAETRSPARPASKPERRRPDRRASGSAHGGAEDPVRARRRRAWACTWLLALGFALGACSEPSPEDPVRAHPPEWRDPALPDWHGARAARDGVRFCTSCHGADLRGDLGAPSCSDCHDGPGGHPFSWASLPAPFHGTAVERAGPVGCGTCHGEDHRGGWSEVSCYTCHTGGPSGHPDGWLAPGASTFHGLKVALEGDDDCRRCHGNDLLGGTSAVACADCH